MLQRNTEMTLKTGISKFPRTSADYLPALSPLLLLHKAHPYTAANIKRPAGMCRNALKKIDVVFQRARFNLVKIFCFSHFY